MRLTDRPNAGYCVDIWHHARGANDMAMITALEPDRVFSIQMNDGALCRRSTTTRPIAWPTVCRPGTGEFDCVGFIRALYDMGVDAPISLEVCSTELWQAPADVAAQAAADGMRRVLAAVAVLSDAGVVSR